MIDIVYPHQIDEYRELLTSMYKARADQFKHRLDWNVYVDSFGQEKDSLDLANPIYLIARTQSEVHQGSLRLLPTTGETLITTHFRELIEGLPIEDPFIWECSRFCLSPEADHSTASDLLIAALDLGLQLKLKFYVAVFERSMKRIYHRYGWSPIIFGEQVLSGQRVCAGLWPVSMVVRESLLSARRRNVLKVAGPALATEATEPALPTMN